MPGSLETTNHTSSAVVAKDGVCFTRSKDDDCDMHVKD
jgi:hypothetical protein